MVPVLHMEYIFHFYSYNGVISETFANLTLFNILKHPTFAVTYMSDTRVQRT